MSACSNNPATTKQKRLLINLASRKGATFSEQELCCTNHANKAIRRIMFSPR